MWIRYLFWIIPNLSGISKRIRQKIMRYNLGIILRDLSFSFYPHMLCYCLCLSDRVVCVFLVAVVVSSIFSFASQSFCWYCWIWAIYYRKACTKYYVHILIWLASFHVLLFLFHLNPLVNTIGSCSLEEFIRTSSIGEFRARLQLLFSLHGQITAGRCLEVQNYSR